MRIALDTETTGLDLFHGCKPFFVTICEEGKDPWFWEWGVNPLTRQPIIPEGDREEILEVIEQAELIVGQNLKFDLHALARLGMEPDEGWPWEKIHDTLISGHLLASDQPHDLTSMSLVYLGINIKPLEVKLKEAVNEARRIARSKYPEWCIAGASVEGLPSAKGTPTGCDYWLPRVCIKQLWESSKCFLARKKRGSTYFYNEQLDGWEYHPAGPNRRLEGHPWWTVLSDYSNADSASTIALFNKHQLLLGKAGLRAIYRERLKILPVIYEMEERGVTGNISHKEELVKTYTQESKEVGHKCVSIAKSLKYDLELPKSGNNNSLLHFCFGKPQEDGSVKNYLKLPVVGTTEKGKPSFDKTAMDSYDHVLEQGTKAHDFISSLKFKRKRDTAVQYLDGYERYWLPTEYENHFRLHPSLNPTGTTTLRFSSQRPNEQNISKQGMYEGDEKTLRYCFGPLPDEEWWSLDFENIELRIPAYESGEKSMIELFEKPDDAPYFGSYHLLNASIVYPDLFWPLAEKKGAFKDKYKSTWYSWCKNGGFAIQYGCQEAKADATFKRKGAFKKIKEKMPKIAELTKKMIDHANEFGFVETLPDITVDPDRGYPLSCSRTRNGRVSPTIPLSYHVQGSACYIAAKAMTKVHAYLKQFKGAGLVMNVHDELVIRFKRGKNWQTNLPKVRNVQELMIECGRDVGIPLKTSCEYHTDNWAKGTTV